MKALLIALLLLLILGWAGSGDYEDALRYEAFRQQMVEEGYWQ
tara:strand:- start:4317 stop:4445 length:129 start_codon:yes stop_codon:yes gene_type:complete